MVAESHKGLLCIADPHLASRSIGRRVDDYSSAILDKLAFCLSYAAKQNLLPAILGDVFHNATEDADWLLDEIEAMLEPAGVVGIFGNHDCSGETLGDDDALARLADRGVLELLDEHRLWRGELSGRHAVVGGAPWGQEIPSSFDRDQAGEPPPPELVIWLAHTDISVLTAADGIEFREIPGIDLVINGHIHTRMPIARTGSTTWCVMGSISRYSGSTTSRGREPAAVRVDVEPDRVAIAWVPIPHRPAVEVFG
jgi:DNA repair exonuclease SbcCD nuclease subunit